jgi:hypothetical protein
MFPSRPGAGPRSWIGNRAPTDAELGGAGGERQPTHRRHRGGPSRSIPANPETWAATSRNALAAQEEIASTATVAGRVDAIGATTDSTETTVC